jgi:hypothetical protein
MLKVAVTNEEMSLWVLSTKYNINQLTQTKAKGTGIP